MIENKYWYEKSDKFIQRVDIAKKIECVFDRYFKSSFVLQ